MKKKLLSTILSVVLTLTMIPVSAFADTNTAMDLASTNLDSKEDESSHVYWGIKDDTLYLSPAETESAYNNGDKALNATEAEDIPWLSNKANIVHVKIESIDGLKIKPLSTAHWFEGISWLTDIDGLANVDTSEVTNMSSMFCNCYHLNSADFSNFNTSNVKNMSYMFESCRGFKTLDISAFDTSNVGNITGMFINCFYVKTIYVSREFKASNCYNYNVFTNCSDLSGGRGTKYDMSHTSGEYARFDLGTDSSEPGYFTEKEPKPVLWYGYSSKTLYLSPVKSVNAQKIGDKALSSTSGNDIPWEKLAEKATKVVFGEDNYYQNEKIMPSSTAYWFEELRYVTNIFGLNKLDTSNVTDMTYMFFNCRALEQLDLSTFDTSNVTNMSYMFYRCYKLKSLDLSSFNTSKAICMHGMFCQLEELTSLNISSFDMSNVVDMGSMFFEDLALKTLDLSSFKTPKAENMDSVFCRCENLVTIYATDEFKPNDNTITKNMFFLSKNLKGGEGTKYSDSHAEGEYARIDRQGQPGYFTEAQH